jgi:hypothetical protein
MVYAADEKNQILTENCGFSTLGIPEIPAVPFVAGV